MPGCAVSCRPRRGVLAARRQAAVQTRADAGSSNGAGYVEEQSFRIERVRQGPSPLARWAHALAC